MKNEILEALAKRDRALSGTELSRQLGVTRAAVWKQVKALQEEGYAIEAQSGRGYRLAADADVLTASGLLRCLEDDAPSFFPEVLQEVTSTNAVLRERAQAGAPEATVVLAAAQTRGRGRMGRSFFSPKDTGLYMSLLLRPETDAEASVHITTLAAVAVADALEEVCGLAPKIKWVNDVYLNGKKICGILTEAAFGLELGRLEYAVLGLGINVYEPQGGFPEEIRAVAGSLGVPRSRDLRCRLAASILRRFLFYYRDMSPTGYLEGYRRRCFVPGHRITVLSGGAAREALALGIDEACRLLVRYDDGEEAALSSGEISIRIQQGESL